MKQKVYVGPDGQRYVGLGRPPKAGEHYALSGGGYGAQRSADTVDGSYASTVALAPVPCEPPEGWEYLIEGGEVVVAEPYRTSYSFLWDFYPHRPEDWKKTQKKLQGEGILPRAMNPEGVLIYGHFSKRYILKRVEPAKEAPAESCQLPEPKRDEAERLLREIVDARDGTGSVSRFTRALDAAKAYFQPPAPPEREPGGRRRKDWPRERDGVTTRYYRNGKVGYGTGSRSGGDRRVDAKTRKLWSVYRPGPYLNGLREGYQAAKGAK